MSNNHKPLVPSKQQKRDAEAAQRPVQITQDLGGFWAGSYQEVKKDLKGRYPKHPWPDDPLRAPATRRAKRKGE